jgi:hypothetical protein
MRDSNAFHTKGRRNVLLRSIFAVAVMAYATMLSREVAAQANGMRAEAIRQVPAPLPKLALLGAAGETKAGIEYHRVILAITNWERYSSEMFLVPGGRKLPPNPCSGVTTRMVIAVYAERGTLLAGCIPKPAPADLGKVSFLIQKGKSIPDFVYIVMHDRHTGAAYRSNMVSPSSGATK